MTGQDLHRLIVEKWGYSYDIQIRRVQNQIFVQVMWRYLEQASFPRSEAEYFQHLDMIASYINAWDGVTQFTHFIEQTRDRPRLGKAVSIPIDPGSRASEWIMDH